MEIPQYESHSWSASCSARCIVPILFSLHLSYRSCSLGETHQRFLKSAVFPGTAKSPSPYPTQPPYRTEAEKPPIREGFTHKFCFFFFKTEVFLNPTGDLPNNIPHQEEEGVLGRGAEVLSVYCYLLVRREEEMIGAKPAASLQRNGGS